MAGLTSVRTELVLKLNYFNDGRETDSAIRVPSLAVSAVQMALNWVKRMGLSRCQQVQTQRLVVKQ